MFIFSINNEEVFSEPVRNPTEFVGIKVVTGGLGYDVQPGDMRNLVIQTWAEGELYITF